MSFPFGDDDSIVGLFRGELFGDGHGGGDERALATAGPEDPGLEILTFPAAFGGLSLPEVGCQTVPSL